MCRRWSNGVKGERFLGNISRLEVHDLDWETQECQIDRIIQSERDIGFRSPDSARFRGYAPCPFCMKAG
jgi:hypothetical protein